MSTVAPSGLPSAVDEVFQVLSDEITFLHADWDAFLAMFGTSENIAPLNDTAPGAFRLIRYALRHSMIMAVCRITDPMTTGKGKNAKDNLTVKRLLHVVEQNCSDKAFLEQLAAKEKIVDAHCEPIRELRNKAIGHIDLQTRMNPSPNPLPDITREYFNQMVALLAEFMNDIIGYYRAAHRDFTPVMVGPAHNIVRCLSEFHRLRKLEHEWLMKGLGDK